MDAISAVLSHPVIAIVLLLGILVFVHELGHFLVGKACGISVEIFSIGFGPVVFSVKKGETDYRLSAIPLGGFVKFYGSVPGEEVPKELLGTEFHTAGLWSRFATIIAGPLANFLLAIVCYFAIGLHGISHPPPLVGEIMQGSPAERAGLQFNDLVTEINKEKIETWQDLHDAVFESPGVPLEFKVNRQGVFKTVTVVPETLEDKLLIPGREHGRIGISPGRVPSVVTVVDAESPAALSGLKTGDRVVAYFDGEARKEVKYWRGFEAALSRRLNEGASSMRLEVLPHDGDAPQSVELVLGGLSKADIGITDSQLTVKKVGDFPDASKLQKGDKILAFDGRAVDNIFAYAKVAGNNRKESVSVTVDRGGVKRTLQLTLKPVEVQRVEGKVTLYSMPAEFLGTMVQPEPVMETYGFFGAIGYGFSQTVKQTKMVAVAIAKLFSGDMPLAALGGPISIAKVASDSVKLGWITFVTSMALISINLGLLNLLPIPVLDGGQLVLLSLEGIRRRPLEPSAIENFQKVGFVVVLSLVVVATYNDFSRFWTDMLKGVAGFFP